MMVRSGREAIGKKRRCDCQGKMALSKMRCQKCAVRNGLSEMALSEMALSIFFKEGSAQLWSLGRVPDRPR